MTVRFWRVGAVLAMMSLAAAALFAQDSLRTFRDSTGQFNLEAELVKFENGQAVLRTRDGREVSVPSSKLSADDQKWIRDELKRRRDGAAKTAPLTAPGDLTATSTAAASSQWPQWRGPNRDGVSPATGLLKSWPADGPPLAWTASGLGRGYSSVAVAEGRIFTLGNVDRQEQMIALNQADGSLAWKSPLTEKQGGDSPNATPVVDGDRVYGVGREGDLGCFEVATGKLLWSKSFRSDFGGRTPGWGFSETPLIDGDRLICTPGSEQHWIVCLNKLTGETIWSTPYDPRMNGKGHGGAGYSSVVISRAAGVKQYVQMTGNGVVGLRADNGEVLWGYNRVANGTATIPTPVVKDDLVFVSSGYGDGGAALLRIVRQGNNFAAQEVYYQAANELQNHHGGMVLLGDYVYLGHGHNNGFPTCVELRTGRVAWGKQRGPGSGSAAICYADGRLYFRYENGVMALIEATPSGYRLLSEFKIATLHDKSWPHPAIADGKLYLRDQQDLHCYDISGRS